MPPVRAAVPAFASSFLPSAGVPRAPRAAAPRARRTAGAAGAAAGAAGPRMSTVVLAPGQGAQAPAMLAAWAAASPAAAAVAAAADAQLGDRLGDRLADLLADAPAERLARTDIAQPAIFVTSMAAWAGMQELGLVAAGDVAAAAGLSLGEYTALAVSGALSFEDGLELVTLRGRAMQDAAEASDGGMVAILGADNATALRVVDACQIDGSVLVAANFNAPGQVVLSGSAACVERAAAYAADELSLRVAKLDVAGAFHSPLMAPAAERLDAALATIAIGAPSVPTYSNVSAAPHDPAHIRARLVEQLTSPVRWADSILAIKDDPALAGASFVELAPGKSLTGIMRKIDRKLRVTNFSAPPAPVAN